MALSTTATATHVLLKYSKSNPSTAAGGPDEWQHYVNPVLTLILDVKKSHAGELESVRLRIIWTMRHGGDSPSTNVVFEDMDLLSFASVQPQHVHPAQGLPLKAVYKDSVVGIRYLHPLVVAPGASPIYRRFQITFSTALDASQFIESIRHVCPCKPNAPPLPGRAMTMMPPSATQTVYPSVLTSNSTTAYMASQPHPSQVHLGARPAQMASPAYQIPSTPAFSLVSSQAPPAPDSDSSSSRAQASSSPLLSATRDLTRNTRHDTSLITGAAVAGTDNYNVADAPQVFSKVPSLPSIPDPTPPTSSLTTSSNSSVPPAPTTAPSVTGETSRDAFLASLRQDPGLDGLSREELENLVAVVVRQPGFVKLLETLDSMWMVKGYLARG